jgi:hypothetical protein
MAELDPGSQEAQEPRETPFLAIGNSEPLPEDLPEELREFIRQGRLAAGWCEHGNKLGVCSLGCIAIQKTHEA